MTVEFARTPIPNATLQHRPDGSSVLYCPLCGTKRNPFFLYFKPADSRLAEQYLAVHTVRLDGQP